jgi:membrane-associated phospholipid phosphatase
MPATRQHQRGHVHPLVRRCDRLSKEAQIVSGERTRPASPRRLSFRRLVIVLGATGLALFAMGLILGLTLVGRHGGGPAQVWDVAVWRWSVAHRGPLVGTDRIIATVGDAGVLGPLCVLTGLAVFAMWRTPRALVPLVAYLGGVGLVYVIREVIHRHRPPTADYPAARALPGVHETSFSYPSGHSVAVTAVVFASLGLLALARHWWWPWLLALGLSAFVADSRLVLGVHWLSDVMVGMALGAIWGTVVAVVGSRASWSDLRPRAKERDR